MGGSTVTGTPETLKALKGLPPALQKKILKAAVKRAAAATAAKAKQLAPVSTGAMRDKIEVREVVDAQGVYRATAGVYGVDYAAHEEWGTVYIDARLFMTRAYEETKDRVIREIEAEVARGIGTLVR